MKTQHKKLPGLLLPMLAAATLAACGGGGDNAGEAAGTAVTYTAGNVFQVGTTTFDPDLPPEPTLPKDAEVCATLEARNHLVRRPDGALPPEADPSKPGVGVAADPAVVNPDQARIQAALDACGAGVEAEVGERIAAADAAATAAQKAAAKPNVNIAGVSGEELAKPDYRAKKYAVRLVVSSTGPGDSFISGPLTLPSGVTLWIDKGVTLYGTRDAKAYAPKVGGPYCANTAVSSSKAGSSGNCLPLIGGNNLVNSAVMGDGAIDSRAYAEIITTDKLYPLMKVDLSCSNTYVAYAKGQQAPDGTACDNGGTIVNSKSSVRNMSWWDLAFLGNMVQNGVTGSGSQSNFRMMVFNYAKNLTLYRITLTNSANFHVVPAGVDGLTVWGVKVQTPTLAAFANPAGNGNPLYTGLTYTEDNVKNTDAFDPGSASKPISDYLTTGAGAKSAARMSFDGYLKNFVFAYNYVSTGDDDVAIKGSQNPSPAGSGLPAIDGLRDVRSDRKHGMILAHNHIYYGHGISIGSETNAGVTNVRVYDNSFYDSEEALRIKSDYARGGEVSNIHYENICIKHSLNALLFTAYYSTKAVPADGPRFPNFHDITLKNVRIEGQTALKFQGLQASSGGYDVPQLPLVMSMENVVADDPDALTLTTSDAHLTIRGVNLPLIANAQNRNVINGVPTKAVDPDKVIDCSKAHVDFPAIGASNYFGSSWDSRH